MALAFFWGSPQLECCPANDKLHVPMYQHQPHSGCERSTVDKNKALRIRFALTAEDANKPIGGQTPVADQGIRATRGPDRKGEADPRFKDFRSPGLLFLDRKGKIDLLPPNPSPK